MMVIGFFKKLFRLIINLVKVGSFFFRLLKIFVKIGMRKMVILRKVIIVKKFIVIG